MLECLENIVGITKSDCPCITNGLTDEQVAALQASTSGLYTDNLPGGIHVKDLKGIDGCANLAEISLSARDNAIIQTETDLKIAINARFGKGKKSYIGAIGQTNFARTLPIQGRFIGLRLKPNQASDGTLKLKKVKLIVSGAETINIYVVKAFCGALTGEIINTHALMTAAGAFAEFTYTTPLELPLSENGRGLEYHILYDRTIGGGLLPKDNKAMCNCSSNEQLLRDYLDIRGIQLNSLTDFENATTSGYSNGLVVDVEIHCDSNKFICREYDENNAVSLVVANCVWFKAGELIIESVLASKEVNRMTMLNREYLWGKRNHFVKEYEARINYLQSIIDIESTDCFICSKDEAFYSAILS